MDRMRRKAFTLVEVLISMIIIGILSGTVMLIFWKGHAKADATRMVSDMISIKKAAQMYYLDNESWFSLEGKPYGVFSVGLLQKYVDRNLDEYSFSGNSWNTARKYRYFLYVNQGGAGDYAAKNNRYNVFVAANVTDKYVDFNVRKALENMAPHSALYKTGYTENLDKDPEDWFYKATENPGDAGSDGGGIVLRIN